MTTKTVVRKVARPLKNTEGQFIYDSVPLRYWVMPSDIKDSKGD